MAFRQEPAFSHGQANPGNASTAILLCNLGTPDAPTPEALRRYLAEFLSDRRVVEIPRLIWLPILHGIILRVRPAKSAAKYASIWTPEGSPLKVWTERQTHLLQEQLQHRGHHVAVRFAMRYGNPSIASELDALRAKGISRVLILPAYPQYSGPTTASVVDAVGAWAAETRNLPEFRFVNRYHDHPAYIEALAARIQSHWKQHGRPDQLLMSFHGVPERTLHLGDPYHCECRKTGRLLAESLGLSADQYKITFQSRFGKAKWLEPYTEPSLRELGASGTGRVDLVCPGFTSDCLETLEEIALEGQQAFLGAGGKVFHYISCLNDDPAWIDGLAAIAEQHMGGWNTRDAPDAAQLARSLREAQALGATR
jgi:ferrochelatase